MEDLPQPDTSISLSQLQHPVSKELQHSTHVEDSVSTAPSPSNAESTATIEASAINPADAFNSLEVGDARSGVLSSPEDEDFEAEERQLKRKREDDEDDEDEDGARPPKKQSCIRQPSPQIANPLSQRLILRKANMNSSTPSQVEKGSKGTIIILDSDKDDDDESDQDDIDSDDVDSDDFGSDDVGSDDESGEESDDERVKDGLEDMAKVDWMGRLRPRRKHLRSKNQTPPFRRTRCHRY